jgi:hypothetical protein
MIHRTRKPELRDRKLDELARIAKNARDDFLSYPGSDAFRLEYERAKRALDAYLAQPRALRRVLAAPPPKQPLLTREQSRERQIAHIRARLAKADADLCYFARAARAGDVAGREQWRSARAAAVAARDELRSLAAPVPPMPKDVADDAQLTNAVVGDMSSVSQAISSGDFARSGAKPVTALIGAVLALIEARGERPDAHPAAAAINELAAAFEAGSADAARKALDAVAEALGLDAPNYNAPVTSAASAKRTPAKPAPASHYERARRATNRVHVTTGRLPNWVVGKLLSLDI